MISRIEGARDVRSREGENCSRKGRGKKAGLCAPTVRRTREVDGVSRGLGEVGTRPGGARSRLGFVLTRSY